MSINFVSPVRSFGAAWKGWERKTRTADLTPSRSCRVEGSEFVTSMGNLMQRVIYHYWYHNGENQAIRQALGHGGLPDFVGDRDRMALNRSG